MRLALVSALAASGLLAAPPSPAAAAAGFAGTWSISGTLASHGVIGKVSPVCVFRQSGDVIAGTCRGPNGIGSASGVVNGNRIQFSWHSVRTTSIGVTGTETFHGTLGGDGVVRGSWFFGAAPGAVGEFTMIRA
ncbi:MAG TPA: hypothetical protein VHT05_01390 [Candidatus Elarobacter sp.]|nr:hypothetical protein [Candidatus Elarobacter sp.]